MQRYEGTRKDYRGIALCAACWDGLHYQKDCVTGEKLRNCIKEVGCECPCVELMARIARKKKNHAEQTAISMDDALEIR